MLYKPNTLIIAYPNGNTTALIVNPTKKILNLDIQKLQVKLLNSFPEVEQCGFVFENSQNQEYIGELKMFGGEFCGNATRSTIQILKSKKLKIGKVKTSGASELLDFEILNEKISLKMPLPKNKLKLFQKIDIGYIVNLEGISHLVITDEKTQNELNQDTEKFKNLALATLKKYNLLNLEAVGCTLLFKNNSARFGVWVKAIQAIFDETACGSGTCACGLVRFLESLKGGRWQILQPSKEAILVEVKQIKELEAWIQGSVKILTTTSLETAIDL